MNVLFYKFMFLPKLEYLRTDQDFKLLDYSLGVNNFADQPEQLTLGSDIRRAFPELVGIEEVISDIVDGEISGFEFEGICRVIENERPLYFDLEVFGEVNQNSSTELIFLLEDSTEKMNLEQAVVQTTNEASLLLGSLEGEK